MKKWIEVAMARCQDSGNGGNLNDFHPNDPETYPGHYIQFFFPKKRFFLNLFHSFEVLDV